MDGRVVGGDHRRAAQLGQRLLVVELVGEVEPLLAERVGALLSVGKGLTSGEHEQHTQSDRRNVRWPACCHGLMIAIG